MISFQRFHTSLYVQVCVVFLAQAVTSNERRVFKKIQNNITLVKPFSESRPTPIVRPRTSIPSK